MIFRPIASVSIISVLVFSSACTTVPEPVAEEVPAVSTYFDDNAKIVGEDIFIGGQPEDLDIAAMRDKGITHVVNFRTPNEMARLDFDEEAALAAAGISYTPIPLGGEDFPYTPAAVEQLTGFMKSRQGPVLLHCGSGYRASVVTVAWLVQEEGMPLDEALTHAQGWWPLRLSEVMGTSFKLVEE